MSTYTAAWPVDRLVDSLARAGWGKLDQACHQGVRSTLRALVALLPHGSASGIATAAQVADATGLSLRWTRRCLHVLEDMGILKWRRGYVREGRPTPGLMRISKRALCALIDHARGIIVRRRKARAQETHDRIHATGKLTLWPQKRRNPQSIHAELSSTSPLLGEVTGRVPRPQTDTSTPTGGHHMPRCIHGMEDYDRCALCRHNIAATEAEPATVLVPDSPLVGMPTGLRDQIRRLRTQQATTQPTLED